ncbi:MAG TPA: TraR/DksA C4-type zinc finger protein [Acidimicrobiales bacterium]
MRKPPTEAETKFFEEQRELLLEEREQYAQQAAALKAEADQLAAEAEGESEFTEEGGDVDSMSAERERDLALANQARQTIDDIDRALMKLDHGNYGICERCDQPIVKARLKALPYAALCVACKSGGLSARR